MPDDSPSPPFLPRFDRRGFLLHAAALPASLATGTTNRMAQQAALAPSQATPGDLGGTWAFRADTSNVGETEQWATQTVRPGADGWSAAMVPGCWERDNQPATLTGPVWYRRDGQIPRDAFEPGARLWWELDAVSYHAKGWAGGRVVGEHTGLWDAFAWEIPVGSAGADGMLPLALKVEKPGGSRFPVRETLAGFLPYVWGTWGGPWQETRLRVTGPCRIETVWAQGDVSGSCRAEADVNIASGSSGIVRFTLADANNRTVATQEVPATTGTVKATLKAADVKLWEPENPNLYTLTVTVLVGNRPSDTKTRRVGFRESRADGDRLLLNGKPVFLRAPLSWGWYEKERAPAPPPEVFRRELTRVRDLGFNGIKLCLWVPPQSYFDIADEMGMLLWLELPMWLPQASTFSRKQTPEEYGRILRQVSSHPSLGLYTVGCEIGQSVDSAFLGELYAQVKAQSGGALVRDNSGSAECYGGPLPEHADFWDFHLYCEAQMARPTFDAFAPRWREKQPFLFGEFNDQDALRDLHALVEKNGGTPPWWTVADKIHNPQGVRWEYGVTEQLKRMTDAGLLARIAELRQSSRHQAWLSRKHTLELTRSYPWMSGYVVTGLADTPISTAGLFDDFGQARISAEQMTPFNADTVLFVEPDRRRAWTAGGDRPSWLDRHSVWSGTPIRRHVGVSHYGREDRPAILQWTATGGGSGTTPIKRLRPGEVREIGLAEFPAPSVSRPQKITLTATLAFDNTNRRVVNSWDYWVFPKPAKSDRRVGLYDPQNVLDGFADATGLTPVPLRTDTGEPENGAPVTIIVATAWRPSMLTFVQNGGRLLLVQPGASAQNTGDGLPAGAVPFWREAMRLFDGHPSWGAFPHENRADFCFYGLAADAAFEMDKVQAVLGPEARLTPVLTRVDARSFALHAYTFAAEVGTGRMLCTTLRPQGGLGDQPSGLSRHVAGTYLLRTWLDYLQG